jgi:hypothetical protein
VICSRHGRGLDLFVLWVLGGTSKEDRSQSHASLYLLTAFGLGAKFNYLIMKNLSLFGVALMAVMFLASCGGSNDKKSEEKVKYEEQVEQTKEIKATLLNGEVSVEGPAGEFIEILDTEIILTKSEIGYQTKIKFKVIGQTDDWLGEMEVMFYDASGNQIMEDGYTFTCNALTRNSPVE